MFEEDAEEDTMTGKYEICCLEIFSIFFVIALYRVIKHLRKILILLPFWTRLCPPFKVKIDKRLKGVFGIVN